MRFQSISALHEAYRSKKTRPSEAVREYLEAIRSSQHNAFTFVCEERATAQGRHWDEVLAKDGSSALERHPLLGVPLGVKDALAIDGVPTTCASKILEGYRPPYTATCVERLEAAGAISMGKLNMDEFAMGSSSENSAFGVTRHPQFPDRVPGGSSGGSAAAVGADLCLVSLGSDTGGSIRLPASFCGIVGVKPSYGRVSRSGLVAFASSLDQVGPMSKNVADSARVLQVMSGRDPLDSTTAAVAPSGAPSTVDWRGLRIGVPKEYFVGGLDPQVEKCIRDSIEDCRKLGAKIVEVSLPHTQYAIATYYIVAVSEASSNLARFDGVRFGARPASVAEAKTPEEYYKKVRSLFGDEVKRRILLGTFALSSGYYDAYYLRACKVRRLIQKDFEQVFQKVDVLATPVSPVTAFKIGEKSMSPLQLYLVDIFTVPASLAGVSAISVPAGRDDRGLPIGLQFIGPAFAEGRVLSTAHAFEKARSS